MSTRRAAAARRSCERCSSSGCGRRSSGCSRPLAARRAAARRGRRRGRSDIGSLDDLARLPFTVKDDLREHYPLGLLAVPREQLVRIHASSGTGGKPTVVGYTRGDLDVWSRGDGALHGDGRRAAAAWSSTTPTATGCSPAGSASTRAPSGSARRSCRSPAADPRARRRCCATCSAQVLCCTPSYALHIAEALRGRGRPDELVARDRPVRRRAVDRGDARAARAPARAAAR